MNVLKVFVLLCGLFTLILLSSQTLVYASDTIIFSASERPYNHSYADFAKLFWQWQFSMPGNEEHPIKDSTGKNCINGQVNSSSPVFYLSGGGGGTFNRTCDVPKDKGLLIPIMTVVASPNEYEGYTFDQIKGVVRADQDSVQYLNLRIDNQTYDTDDLSPYRTNPTSAFAVNYLCCPTLFGGEEGPTTLASADGYYIVTKPLSPGKHIVHFDSGLGDSPITCKDPASTSCAFAQDITYNLNVS